MGGCLNQCRYSVRYAGAGVILFSIIRVPAVLRRVVRFLAPPPPRLPELPRVFRGPLPYHTDDADQFFGRSADAEICERGINRKPFFVLEGESGSGKSSLLETALLPMAQKRFNLVPCRCGDDPFGKLRAKLLNVHYEPGRMHGRPELIEAIKRAQANEPNDPAHPLLVVIDQFEELFVAVRDETRRQFVETLGDAIASGKLRLVIVLRKDFSDLLRDLRLQVDPDNRLFAFDRESYHVLRTFSVSRARNVLYRMLDQEKIHAGHPLRRLDLDDFAKALVEELKRPPLDARLCREDEPVVLPVELQIVGWTYETILEGDFSAQDLSRRGGKLGIYETYIEDAKDYVACKTGVTGAVSVLVSSN